MRVDPEVLHRKPSACRDIRRDPAPECISVSLLCCKIDLGREATRLTARTPEIDGVWIMGRHRMARRFAAVEVPSQGRVHWWTSARKTPKKSHFVSLFRPPGVASWWQSSIRKPFHARQIGPDTEASQRAKHDVGRGPPKVSYRCSLIVQYLWPKNAARDSPAARG